MEKVKYWTTDRIMYLIIGVILAAGLVWLLGRLSNVLLPFFAACLISYLLNPLVNLNARWMRLKYHTVAVFITLLEVTALLVGLFWIFGPTIGKELEALGNMLKTYTQHETHIPFLPPVVSDYIHNFDVSELTQFLSASHLMSMVSNGSNVLMGSIETLLHLVEWLLMFIYIIFILIDYDQIVRGFKMIFPQKYREQAMVIVGDVKDYMNHYFRGQGLLALCAAVFYSIGFSIIGLPLAIVMGIIVGILYMIPYFQYVTLIPVALICFINALGGHGEFLPDFGKCLIVYVVSQSICDYILTPHIMGKEMGLNPAVILLALSVWGSLLGILGMIIALPTTAILISYYARYISSR